MTRQTFSIDCSQSTQKHRLNQKPGTRLDQARYNAKHCMPIQSIKSNANYLYMDINKSLLRRAPFISPSGFCSIAALNCVFELCNTKLLGIIVYISSATSSSFPRRHCQVRDLQQCAWMYSSIIIKHLVKFIK